MAMQSLLFISVVICVQLAVVISQPDQFSSVKSVSCTGEGDRNFLCCDGRRIRRRPHWNLFCCAKGAYKAETQTCCNGVIRTKPRKQNDPSRRIPDVMCCDTAAYDHRVKTCCGGEVKRFPVNVARQFIECCGKRLIDVREKMCCNGVGQERKPGKTECCGRWAYDPTQERCVNGERERL